MSESRQFTFDDDRFGQPTKVRAEFTMYQDGTPAIKLLVHGNQNDSFDGEPWGTATYNPPERQLEAGRIVVKGWAEGEGLPELLAKAGIIKPQSVDKFEINHIEADIFELTPEAFEASEDAIAKLKSRARLRP